ncbi:MAG: TraR/DksA C4-type zinc finger protein [Chloroflexi bacterium]|nr:TraR/DksA C4-type zinc finger protein [Chloroflexota bacterium]
MNKQHFRKRLTDEKARLRRDLDATRPVIDEGRVGYSTHQADDASDVFEQSKNETVHEQLEWLLAEVEHALTKFDAGTYGVCEVCGKPIGDNRLEALPTARYCMDDQIKVEKRANIT